MVAVTNMHDYFFVNDAMWWGDLSIRHASLKDTGTSLILCGLRSILHGRKVKCKTFLTKQKQKQKQILLVIMN